MIDESRPKVQGVTDDSLAKMLLMLEDGPLSPEQWMRECLFAKIGVKAFCEGVPLLLGANLVRFYIQSSVDVGMDTYWYRRIK